MSVEAPKKKPASTSSETKTKKTAASKKTGASKKTAASKKTPATETAPGTASMTTTGTRGGGITATPPVLVDERMTQSAKVLASQLGTKLIAQEADGTWRIADREKAQAALVALGGKRWAKDTLVQLDSVITDLNDLDPNVRVVFVI